jgi:hypothetical protein
VLLKAHIFCGVVPYGEVPKRAWDACLAGVAIDVVGFVVGESLFETLDALGNVTHDIGDLPAPE